MKWIEIFRFLLIGVSKGTNILDPHPPPPKKKKKKKKKKTTIIHFFNLKNKRNIHLKIVMTNSASTLFSY